VGDVGVLSAFLLSDYTFYADSVDFTGYSGGVFIISGKIRNFAIAHIDNTTHFI
jgi:hypothetical protein